MSFKQYLKLLNIMSWQLITYQTIKVSLIKNWFSLYATLLGLGIDEVSEHSQASILLTELSADTACQL